MPRNVLAMIARRSFLNTLADGKRKFLLRNSIFGGVGSHQSKTVGGSAVIKPFFFFVSYASVK